MRVTQVSYPLHLDLANKRVVVVGAGSVALRRVQSLLDAGALVTVIAPSIHAELQSLEQLGTIQVIARPYQEADLAGAWLVHIATDDQAVNTQVATDATRQKIWSVRADAANISEAKTPAVGRVGDVTVSVTSGDPVRSVDYRNQIVSKLEHGQLHARARRQRPSGSVTLVGGGPGATDLMTLRGYRALLDADVVVYDRLAPLELLEQLPADVERIDASKSPNKHVLTQDEINAVIVDKALQGFHVVRLKGGDPFVFGRGSEEMNACIAAGVPVEVVPGVTSAISAPSAAGIPVTHRGISAGFIVLSGHHIGDLHAVVQSGLTTVVLMGVATLPQLVEQFLANGASPSHPIAVIEHAFSPNQKTLKSTLEHVVAQAQVAQVANPAVIVIGHVVNAIDTPEQIDELLVSVSGPLADVQAVTSR